MKKSKKKWFNTIKDNKILYYIIFDMILYDMV